MGLTEGDIDEGFIADARSVVVTGTHLSHPRTEAAVLKALRIARENVTAAASAHVNRLPVLLIPGDIFASRRPDPVLQQIEDFDNGTVSANDCFRPVARYYDRITRPEHLPTALPRAMAAMTDPQNAGPVVLAFC